MQGVGKGTTNTAAMRPTHHWPRAQKRGLAARKILCPEVAPELLSLPLFSLVTHPHPCGLAKARLCAVVVSFVFLSLLWMFVPTPGPPSPAPLVALPHWLGSGGGWLGWGFHGGGEATSPVSNLAWSLPPRFPLPPRTRRAACPAPCPSPHPHLVPKVGAGGLAPWPGFALPWVPARCVCLAASTP